MIETWTSRDRPLLEFLLSHEDSGINEVLGPSEIASRLEWPREDVHTALKALAAASPPYIDFDAMHVTQVCERVRRELGTWPSADALLEQLWPP